MSVTPKEVGAAAKAIQDVGIALHPSACERFARAALTAAASISKQRAKAEALRNAAKALREAADEVEAECSTEAGECFCGSSEWLRNRANRIEGKKP